PLDHRFDVVTRNRLVRLERVGHREHLRPVALEQRARRDEQLLELRLDALAEARLEEVLLLLLALVLARLPASTDADLLRHAVRRDRGAHSPIALHQRRELRGALEVAGDARRAVAVEEEPLAGERREA